MHFDDAIAAHINWKLRLSRYIDGTLNEKLDSATVCKDNLCALGKWIYGDGEKYKSAPHFESLVARHAKFHLCAADVVKKVDADDKAGAKSLLAGDFAAISRETVSAIMELKTETA
ncbi:MAG: CZB domain-containing protein [Betaproteobacteria bacterium]|nr:CZB domain-containing protein [Betaproteobacteria bacterium]